jgi:hypothetical protein
MRTAIAIVAAAVGVVVWLSSSPHAATINIGSTADYKCTIKPEGGRCVCKPGSTDGWTCDGFRAECKSRGAKAKCIYPPSGEAYCYCGWGDYTPQAPDSNFTPVAVSQPGIQLLSR